MAALALAVLGLSCSHRQPAPPPRPVERPKPPEPGGEVGLASYYHRSLEGRLTASGAPYRATRLTCAHRTLPLGSRVRVTNLENGRTVELVVNDRGPFVRGRVVDLSKAAARKLGFVNDGLARVRVQRVDGAVARPVPPRPANERPPLRPRRRG